MPEKIVYYTDGDVFGGTEQIMLYLLAGLDRRRWEPVLFYHRAAGNGPLIAGARDLGVRSVAVPRLIGAGSLSRLPGVYWRLRRENPAVFHAHLNWLLSSKYGLLAAAASRRPVVIATAQQYLLPPWTRFVSLQQQFLEHLVDQYLAVCEAVAHQLQRSFQVPARKIRVVHNSIPVNESPHPSVEVQRLRRTLAEGRHLVLTVARLDRQKGHTYLLKAIAQIPQAVFLFVGDGPERKKLQDQARHLGVDQRVVFLGFRQDVPSLLAGCDLFVLPSLYEGLPLSILEAMAAGKPVIATDVGGNAEAVLQGETGYLVPPGDPPAIASAIQRLLSDPALAVKFGQAGQARVRERFSVTSMVRCVEDTYEELLLKRRNHRS